MTTAQLARMRPIVTTRRRLLVAHGADVIAAGTMSEMDTVLLDFDLCDLWFDANSVAGDMVAECWISHGPRADDADFDPAPGDRLTMGDGDEAPLRARVIKRQGDRVSVQVELIPSNAAVV